MRLGLILLACGAVLATGGCGGRGPWFTRPSAAAMPPEAFAEDPVQRRLAVAADRGDAAAVAAAVAAGADVDATGKAGFRLLYWLMCRGRVEGFAAVVRHGGSLAAGSRDVRYLPDGSFAETVLEHVVGSTDTRFLEAALAAGLDPNHMPHPEDGMSLLFIAVTRHSIPAIKTLLKAGAAIDHQDASGYTPLVHAMLGCNYNEAWVLLELGADPTLTDHLGHDLVWGLRQWGSRGVRPDHRVSFDRMVAELIGRGLLTREDIAAADRLKPSAFDDDAARRPPAGQDR